MIRNIKYPAWKIDGNVSLNFGKLDEREAWIRSELEESHEQERLRLEPDAWEVVPGHLANRLIESPGSCDYQQGVSL